MYKVDYHIHSALSIDGDPESTIENIIKTAADKKLDEIAVCDHYDVNWVVKGENPDIDFQASLEQINAAKEKHKIKDTKILLGIELGQPHHIPEKAAEVLGKNDFDFILCALHNARNEKDFWGIDYKNTTLENLIRNFEKYTEELSELANWGNFHSLAHITYPIRYCVRNNFHIPVHKYTDLYIKLFKILIHRGIALEVNASGLRKDEKQTMPPCELLKLYKETGGELLTVGSDAHYTSDIFSGIEQTYGQIHALGFKYITTVKDKKLTQRKIEI